MTDTPALIFYAVALILPISALVARRIPAGTLVKMVLIWVAIFGVGAIAVRAIT